MSLEERLQVAAARAEYLDMSVELDILCVKAEVAIARVRRRNERWKGVFGGKHG